jgi:hypothetical protein
VFTEQNGSQVFEGQQHGGREAWGREEEDPRFTTTPPDGQFPMHNGGHVKFEVPKVPVIFVLGKIRFLLRNTLAEHTEQIFKKMIDVPYGNRRVECRMKI